MNKVSYPFAYNSFPVFFNYSSAFNSSLPGDLLHLVFLINTIKCILNALYRTRCLIIIIITILPSLTLLEFSSDYYRF